jgi:hypothetical protein
MDDRVSPRKPVGQPEATQTRTQHPTSSGPNEASSDRAPAPWSSPSTNAWLITTPSRSTVTNLWDVSLAGTAFAVGNVQQLSGGVLSSSRTFALRSGSGPVKGQGSS